MARDYIIPVDTAIYSSSLDSTAVFTQIIRPPIIKGQDEEYYFYATRKIMNEK